MVVKCGGKIENISVSLVRIEVERQIGLEILGAFSPLDSVISM